MKTALQEADEVEGKGTTPVVRDTKGREIISQEEKARRDEKARNSRNLKAAADVRLHRRHEGPVTVDRAALYRNLRRGKSACRISLRICVTVTSSAVHVCPG
ncbi:hypothetical protein F5888DRAFT_1746034 [Russula emetica]|nr:hypothetical protein F5888DRAFT_1746034 [Russula emetica]